MRLHDGVVHFANHTPDSLAVKDVDGSLTYAGLDKLANQIARGLSACGVTKGHRVAIWLDKTVLAVATMHAVLRLGAAYVPVDPLSPASRAQLILADCGVSALVSTVARIDSVSKLLPELCAIAVDGNSNGSSWDGILALSNQPLADVPTDKDDLAFILYTSGSTGTPKGVCISHANAMAFVEWAMGELAISHEDILANHAPFHFDLSVFDLYAAFQSGACVFLIPDGLSFSGAKLVEIVEKEKPTIWYSVPSVLILMMQYGGLLEMEKLPLRAILFAGEVFPISYLRQLKESWPSVRLLNLYGPTETNVCTFYEVKHLEKDRITPVPIGQACSGDQAWVVKSDGSVAGLGEEGELMVEGDSVMLGYWNKEPQGDKPYATGDIVRVLEDDSYEFVSRCDHMVKIRGHRVELGEIEAVLQQHPSIQELAVITVGKGVDARLVAFIVENDEEEKPTLLAIKKYCSEHLPRYMIIDRIRFIPQLPRTRTGKVDRIKLTQLMSG